MSLRAQVLRGGVYLSLRQGLGMFISLGGMLLLTRAIGPGAYGLYSASLGIYTYLFNLSQWGVGVYLIRQEGKITSQEYHQAFSLLLLLGIAGMSLSFLGLPLIARWTRLEGFIPVAASIFAGLPLALLTLPPLALLERTLDYRRVALVELGGQVAFYIVALPLAFSGFGVWAAVAGWWSSQLLVLGLLYRVTGYRPRWYWNSSGFRTMVSYGLSFSASMWVWQLRSLVNPLIVGRYVGAEAVGIVALSIRMVEFLSFVKNAVWRLSIATFTRLQNEKERLINAVNEGMCLQVLTLGPLLLGFALCGPWIIPLMLGTRWEFVVEIFPFIALSYLVNTLFSLHSSVLYVIQRNWEVASFHLLHIILFAGGTWLLVPQLGFIGYGWGEVIAFLSYPILHLQLVKHVKKPNYMPAGVWTLAFAIGLFWQSIGMAAFLPLLGILVWPATWRILKVYWETIRGLSHG